MTIEQLLTHFRNVLNDWQYHYKRYDALKHCQRHIDKYRKEIYILLRQKYKRIK